MPPKKKLSGAELLAELGTTSLDRAPPAPSAPAASPATTTGRPSKVGGAAMPLTLRVSADQYAALSKAALARDQARQEAGEMVRTTPQDILRILLDRAMADPNFPATVIDQDPS